ncbi:molybdenum ABC transporter ATP-binding protein [Pararhizobium gei]|uniref:molybdenum ABC transporter ATP-binding protein n=1 Tax=Pararhizobium gei TaxID=1395951 RepID=UPI0023DB6973|nr:molybdenum ABC transporter ATP-binding protein [Rhizobium gei]
MSLDVDIRHRIGGFDLHAAFSASRGVTALFGRSGSGKTSLINLVAGLLRPDAGRITFDDEILADSATRSFVPPHRRRFGYVFQEARLFPHLSVRRNLLYGRWFSQSGKTMPDFSRIVDLLNVGPLLDRAPANLSGGEKQRIAIGRALLSSPRLLIMDEPLAALDDERKADILPYLERLRDEAGLPILYVSHALGEVARLADKAILLDQGRVVAAGDTALVLSAPSAAVSRREAGVLLEGMAGEGDDEHHITPVHIGALLIRGPQIRVPAGKPVRLRIAARDVMLATSRPEGLSALNIFDGTVLAVGEPVNGMVDVHVNCAGTTIISRITSLSFAMMGLGTGRSVYAIVKSVALEP